MRRADRRLQPAAFGAATGFRFLALLLTALLPTACDSPPLGEAEVEIRVSGAPDEIEIGRSFPLTVVRVWTRELEPDPWNDAALAPLTVRLEDVSRREDAVFIEETRRFRAYALEPGAATVSPITFSAAPGRGGPSRTAATEAFSIRVKGTLDPKTAGPPELPGTVPEPARWWIWAALALAAIGGGLMLRRASARRAREDESGSNAAAVAREHALARIASLRGRAPRTTEEIESWHRETSALVRDYLAEARRIHAREMTTEELLSASTGTAREHLDAALTTCDVVRFGRAESTASGRERVLAAAERLIRDGGGPKSRVVG